MRSTRPRIHKPDVAKRLFLRRVWRQLCPQCGRGALFARWARLRERCGVCGLVYRRESGAEMGSMTLSALVNTALASLLFLGVWALTDWEAWLGLAVSVPVMVVVSYGLLPLFMSLWVAVEYLTDVANGEWWARPRP